MPPPHGRTKKFPEGDGQSQKAPHKDKKHKDKKKLSHGKKNSKKAPTRWKTWQIKGPHMEKM